TLPLPEGSPGRCPQVDNARGRVGANTDPPASGVSYCSGARSLAEDPVEVGATHRALALSHAAAIGLHHVPLSLALLLALHAVELALVGLVGLRHGHSLLIYARAEAPCQQVVRPAVPFHPRRI